jgi:hypothetical protein
MSDADYDRCLCVLYALHAPHNWQHVATAKGIVREQYCVRVRLRGELATFDGNDLTKLVKAAHLKRVRVSVRGVVKGVLELMLHPRSDDGHLFERHPGIEALR